MSPVLVAFLFVSSIVPACHAQTAPSLEACPTAATLTIVGCLSPLGDTNLGLISQHIASKDIKAMINVICDADKDKATIVAMLTCLKTPLALCNQSDTIVQMLGGASGEDIEDLCMHRAACPNIVDSLQGLGGCLGMLRTITASTACTVANTACGCIETESNVCAAASNAQLFSSRVVMAHGAAQRYSCKDSAVPACVSALPVITSTTAGSTAVGPAILLFVAMALFRFF